MSEKDYNTFSIVKGSIVYPWDIQHVKLSNGIIDRLVRYIECSLLGAYMLNLFDMLFQALPSLLAEDYRSLSVDRVRHGA